MVTGLDKWTTRCSIVKQDLVPMIELEAKNGTLFVRLGLWDVRQAREVARMINDTCDRAEGFVGGNGVTE